MDPDDDAYRRSVRNMIFVLAAIVVTVFAAIFIPPYFNAGGSAFPTSTSYDSGVGFTMNLTVNYSAGSPTWVVALEGWVNSTSPQIENVTAADSWAFPLGRLWTRLCTPGWPIGLGVMQGHYTQDNYSLGALLPLNQGVTSCPTSAPPPGSFAFEPHTSKALVVLGGSPEFWVIQSSLRYTGSTPGYQLPPGIYTAILADEWGDVLTANFRAA